MKSKKKKDFDYQSFEQAALKAILVVALLPQVFFTTFSTAQKNLILNPGFEKLNLVRIGPTFIDGQFYDGLRYDTSVFWARDVDKE